jgi:branched-chain amino acid transport system ATP-binding protein
MALLEVRALSKRFGGVQALKRMNLSVEFGQIVGLIGPNGAGKTSFFNCITGLLATDEGQILFGPRREALQGMAAHRILEKGIARTFQNLRIFRNMTVFENVAVGFHARTNSGLWDAFFRTKRFYDEERMIHQKSMELLQFVGLGRSSDEIAQNLPYGAQKRLEIARALASRPQLLLLDEPVAGMNPTEKEELAGLIRQIRERGVAILLIEHDMKMVMPLSEKVVVMDEGQVIAEGSPEKVRSDPQVIRAYLGETDS